MLHDADGDWKRRWKGAQQAGQGRHAPKGGGDDHHAARGTDHRVVLHPAGAFAQRLDDDVTSGTEDILESTVLGRQTQEREVEK